MNKNELAAELARNDLTVPKAAEAIGICRKAFYEKMNGISEFKQSEIKALKHILKLSDTRTAEIFLLIKFPKGNLGNVKFPTRAKQQSERR